jgi:methionyl-tRNA formyltransferase
MRVGIIGRSRILLDTAMMIAEAGYDIPFVYTCKSEKYYQCDESTFSDFSKSINADFYNDLLINSEKRVNEIEKYSCDVAITFNWLTILKAPICSSFTHGIWNAHAGDLPKYRGNACLNWAIINNEKEVGLSIHEVQPNKLDSGDILKKIFYTLTDNTYISDGYDWLSKEVPQLFLEALSDLKNGNLQRTPQSTDQQDILRCYPRRAEDSKIDWKKNNHEVHRLIRASSKPFNGAFCFLENDKKITIWRASPCTHHGKYHAMPGQILFKNNQSPVVACGDGLLLIEEATFTGTNVCALQAISKSLRNRLF